MSMRITPFVAVLAFVATLPVAAQSAETGTLYRCPGNDYNNTISASEAEKLHCKKVENASVTVIQSARPAASAASSAITPMPQRAVAAPADAMNPVESAALRTRATNSRRALEDRLKTEESKLSALEKEFNGGEPERQLEEIDLPKYLDRVGRMRSAIARKQIEVAELRREIDKLPTR